MLDGKKYNLELFMSKISKKRKVILDGNIVETSTRKGKCEVFNIPLGKHKVQVRKV